MRTSLFLLSFFLALISFGALALADEKIWSLCGDKNDLLQISDIKVNPSPPIASKEFTVIILGSLKSDVTDGNTHLVVNFDDAELVNGDMPLCTSLPDFKCPLKAGPQKITVSEVIPDIAPVGGPYWGNITLTDQNKNRVTCVAFKFYMQAPELQQAKKLDKFTLADPRASAVNSKIIEQVNTQPASSWKAGVNENFVGKTVAEVRKTLGAKNIRTQPRLRFSKSHLQAKLARLQLRGVPESFDWRKEAPQCVHPIRDQGNCGSCWAFGASEALSDRFCVASKGAVNVVLSPEYLVDCDNGNFGCDGGYLEETWNFIASRGLPTEECYPYVAGKGTEGVCNSTCADGSPMKLYKTKSVDAYYSEADMMETIATQGPIEGAFTVYEDFMQYKSGVYKHTSGGLLGGHAIKIVGYGKDAKSGLKYWICVNSWGNKWGDKGTFLIARGDDECGIESNAIAGVPQL